MQAFAETAAELPGDHAGVFRSAELWYMFGTLNRAWRLMEEGNYRLSERMLDCWTGFMKTGDPDVSGRASRMPYTEKNLYIQIFDIRLP